MRGETTDWARLARPWLRELEPYDPGSSRDELKAIHQVDDLAPLNWNEDLFGTPRHVLDAAAAEVGRAALYPHRAYADFRLALGGWLGVPEECVTPAHGAQSLISAIAAAARSTAARVVWLCDPNNPTGILIGRGEWAEFLDRLPDDCIAVVDEAYIDFSDPDVRAHREDDILAGRPVIVIRSCSKVFGLAGLRLGYAIADPQVGRLLNVVQEPFNVNRAAVETPGFVPRRRAEVAAARDAFTAELAAARGSACLVTSA